MKDFIQKYESIFRWLAIFFLIFWDIHLISFTTSLADSNPIGAVFMFSVGLIANVYFQYLYTSKR